MTLKNILKTEFFV